MCYGRPQDARQPNNESPRTAIDHKALAAPQPKLPPNPDALPTAHAQNIHMQANASVRFVCVHSTRSVRFSCQRPDDDAEAAFATGARVPPGALGAPTKSRTTGSLGATPPCKTW